jgi:glycosyltransferase involved in cell wall biosynthesis
MGRKETFMLMAICEESPLRRVVRPNVGIPRVTKEVTNWLASQGIRISWKNCSEDAKVFSLRKDFYCSYSAHWLLGETTGNDVLTIHDCREIEHPRWSPHTSTSLKLRVRSHWLRGGTIHVFTRAVEKAICEHIGQDGPIVVARLDPIVDHENYHMHATPAVSMHYPLEIHHKPIILVVGSEAEHKGLIHLLDCWRKLNSNDANLVLIGPRSSASNAIDLHPALRMKSVFRIGEVSEREKMKIMRQSSAVITPSMHEGLGLVLVEALQLKKIVIASEIPAHIEVGGGHAYFFSPGTDMLAGKIEEAIAGNLRNLTPFSPVRDDTALLQAFKLDQHM